jgi:hypothetical protein
MESVGLAVILRRGFVGALLIVGLAINLYGIATVLPHLRLEGAGDWLHLAGVDPSDPYATPAYRWAPPVIVVWDTVIERMGFVVWALLHVAAVALLRRPILIGLALVSWPFWADVVNGNTVTFAVVATALALEGRATTPFFFMAVFIPRPVMLPALLWILWKQPATRTTFLTVVGIMVMLSLGHLDGWIHRLISTAPREVLEPFNIGPSQWFGLQWMLVGIPVGAWLLWRGWVGLAGLAWSPYWLSYYLLMPIVDWRRWIPGSPTMTEARERTPQRI